MITRILVPTDGSVSSEKAGMYAIDIAKRYGASVTVIHVIHSKNGSAKRRLKELDKSAIKHAEDFINSISSKSEAEEIKTKTKILLSKSVPDAILKEARSHECDLIVMGAKGLTGLKKFLIGSVSEQVIRYATCPVFIYR